jgi:predicted transcriptional regulator
MAEPEADKDLLEMTALLGRIPVTQDNQPQIQRLVADGLIKRDDESHSYILTETGEPPFSAE